MDWDKKKDQLREWMCRLTAQDAAVAFSGGVDSSLLLQLAVETAAEQGTVVYAITANTELHPSCDLEIAAAVADQVGARHIVVSLSELDHAGIKQNPVDRCYRCKRYLFEAMQQKAAEYGVSTLIEGTNVDDLKVYRPGLKAIEELGVISPLKEAGFTKEDVRHLAAEYGIAVANRPAAPCLATRFPYGTTLIPEELEKVEKGEAWLRELGFYNVRLRVHGECARIEVDEQDFDLIFQHRKEILKHIKEIGYAYVSLDLQGFRSGSMDEKLQQRE